MADDLSVFKELGADIKAMRDELAAMKKSADAHRDGLPDHSAGDLAKLDVLVKSVDAAAAAAKDAIGRADASDAALKAARAQIEALEKGFGDLKTAASIGRATDAALGKPDPLALGKLAKAVFDATGGGRGGVASMPEIAAALEKSFGPSDPTVALVKAQATSPASAGGAIVPEIFNPSLFTDILRSAQIFSRIGGVQRLSSRTGLERFPIKKTGTTFAYVAENGARPETSMTFGSISMAVKSLGGIVVTSREWLTRSDPSALSIIQRDMIDGATEIVDKAMLYGPGDVTTPIKGVKTWTDSADHIPWVSGARDDIDAVLAAAAIKLASVNMPRSARAWIMNEATAINIGAVRQSDSYAYPEMRGSAPSLNGMAVITSNNCPTAEIYLIEGTAWIDVYKDTLELAMSEHGDYFVNNQSAFRLGLSHDFAGRYENPASTSHRLGAAVITGVAF